MMTFALLFAGWAYADDATGAANDYPITVTVGEGGEDLETGIYNNAYASWATSMVPANYWQRPKMFTFEYVQLTDEGEEASPVNRKVVNEKVQGVGGETYNNFQFPVDRLVPNTLYKVRFFVSEEVAEGNTPLDEQKPCYQSKWVYFLSAPAQLQQGTLVWNWEPGKTVEGQEGLEYEYLGEADQVKNNGGLMMFDYDEFFHSYSIYTTLPEVTGTVEIWKDGAKLTTVTGTVTDPEAEHNDVTNFTTGLQLAYGHEYELKAYASYEYEKKTLYTNEDATEFYRIEKEGTGLFTSDPVLTRGPRTYGDNNINPLDIHVGTLTDNGVDYTTVTLVNLPGAGEVNTCIGYLYYKTADMAKPAKLGANMWEVSGVAQWWVPVTDKEFTFSIEIIIQDDEINPETGSNLYSMTTPQDGTVHMGNPLTVNLWDKYLIWGEGTNVTPSYTLPLPEGIDYTGVNFQLHYYRRHHNDSNYPTYESEFNASGNYASTTTIITDDETGEKFVKFTGFSNRVQEQSWFVKMEVSASLPANDHTFWDNLKKTWDFYTAEGCVVEEMANLHQSCVYECSSDLFRGEVTARQWDDPTKPLMWPDDGTPKEREAARLHFYDWAWSPAAATITKLGIEYDRVDGDDEVEFKSTTYEERKTLETTETYSSEIAYIVPTKYNNAQAIGALTADEGTYQEVTGENDAVTTEFVSFKQRSVTPTAEAQTFTDGGWGAKFAATAADTEGNINLKKAYGPHVFVITLTGEVPEGRTATTEQGFTIACRQGLVNLGSAGTEWNAEEYGVIQPINFQPTDQQHRPTAVPQYIVNSIYNNIYSQAWGGYCEFDIYATLTEVDADDKPLAGGQTWTEHSAHGYINELGEVKLNNYMIFTEATPKHRYVLEGYMLYTPVRYMDLKTAAPYDPNAASETNPEVGPVVKVPFKQFFTYPEVVPVNETMTPEVRYWILPKKDGVGYVEARVYDKYGTINKFMVELLDNESYTADGITKPEGTWHDATTETNEDGEVVVKELGYWSFEFPVDADLTTADKKRVWQYSYNAYYYNDTETGPVTFVDVDDPDCPYEAIFTPDPYRNFEKHDPATTPNYESELVGPWDLEEFCAQLTNFFAFTDKLLPTEFENWEEYWGNDEIAWNLVYGCIDQPTAPARRASEVKYYYAPIVRLNDATHEVEFGYADDPEYVAVKKTVRYEFFNDVEFTAGDAKYTGKFNAKNLKRTVMVPFNATTEATVQKFQSITLDEAAKQVNFVFANKLDGEGEPNNALTATYPYIVKAAANGDVDFVGTEVKIHKSTEKANDYSVKLMENGITIMEAHMWGLYKPTWNQDFVVADPELDYYRYSNGILQIPEKGDDGMATGWGGEPELWKPNWKGVNAFECVFTFWTNSEVQSEYSISVRFGDEEGDDATMIENINVVTESNELFDLMGRKVVEPVKGQIYIQNGKKILF